MIDPLPFRMNKSIRQEKGLQILSLSSGGRNSSQFVELQLWRDEEVREKFGKKSPRPCCVAAGRRGWPILVSRVRASPPWTAQVRFRLERHSLKFFLFSPYTFSTIKSTDLIFANLLSVILCARANLIGQHFRCFPLLSNPIDSVRGLAKTFFVLVGRAEELEHVLAQASYLFHRDRAFLALMQLSSVAVRPRSFRLPLYHTPPALKGES